MDDNATSGTALPAVATTATTTTTTTTVSTVEDSLTDSTPPPPVTVDNKPVTEDLTCLAEEDTQERSLIDTPHDKTDKSAFQMNKEATRATKKEKDTKDCWDLGDDEEVIDGYLYRRQRRPSTGEVEYVRDRTAEGRNTCSNAEDLYLILEYVPPPLCDDFDKEGKIISTFCFSYTYR